MVGRVHRLGDRQLGAAVGAVLVRLAALVLDDLELLLQLLGGDHVGQRGQAIGLQPEERLQQVARPDLVVVRPVVAGGAVVVAAPALHDRVERRVGRVARPHEHQVLEQVREAGPSGHLVLRADVVPEIDGHERARPIRVEDHPKPVGQCVRFELDFEHRRGDERGIMARIDARLASKARFSGGRLDRTAAGRRRRRSRRLAAAHPVFPGSRGRTTAFPDRWGSCCRSTSRRRSASRPRSASSSRTTAAPSWVWTCEQPATSMANVYTVGAPPADRFYALSLVTGLSFSDDESCGWQSAGGALAGQKVSDFFTDPPTRCASWRRRLLPPTVAARRWRRSTPRPTAAATFGATPLYTAPAGASIVGIEIARSDPQVVYLTYVTATSSGYDPTLVRSSERRTELDGDRPARAARRGHRPDPGRRQRRQRPGLSAGDRRDVGDAGGDPRRRDDLRDAADHRQRGAERLRAAGQRHGPRRRAGESCRAAGAARWAPATDRPTAR